MRKLLCILPAAIERGSKKGWNELRVRRQVTGTPDNAVFNKTFLRCKKKLLQDKNYSLLIPPAITIAGN